MSVARTKEQVFKLTACKGCGFVACCCRALTHAEDCAHRRHVLALDVKETTPACTCGKEDARQAWIAKELARWSARQDKPESEAA